MEQVVNNILIVFMMVGAIMLATIIYFTLRGDYWRTRALDAEAALKPFADAGRWTLQMYTYPDPESIVQVKVECWYKGQKPWSMARWGDFYNACLVLYPDSEVEAQLEAARAEREEK